MDGSSVGANALVYCRVLLILMGMQLSGNHLRGLLLKEVILLGKEGMCV